MTITAHVHPIDPKRVAHARSRLPNADDAARLNGPLSLRFHRPALDALERVFDAQI